MRVLDIDLDFFLDSIYYGGSDGRLDPSDYKPWVAEEVRAFLGEQCGLSKEPGIRAKLVVKHEEVFYHWRETKRAPGTGEPFSVVHIDAHADLGMGDSSFHYIQTELLHRPPEDRAYPEVGDGGGLTEGNYLAFAIACRWIRDLVYVHHPCVTAGTDLPRLIFKDEDPETRIIQLKKYPRGADLTGMSSKRPRPVAAEPEVPVILVSGPDFRTRAPFDFAYVARSPGYTPQTADLLLPVFEEFLRF